MANRVRAHRFYVPRELLEEPLAVLPPETARQVTRVLRLGAGARIVLFCGDGTEREAVLESAVNGSATARLGERRSPDVELRCRLHVAVAVLKGEKLDWLVQKLVELGAARVSLLRTERTVVAAGEERWPRRLERYRRIAREAAEQCGRVRVPEVEEPRSLATLLAEAEGMRRVLLAPGAPQPLAARLRPLPEGLLLCVGPEGGFTEEEVRASLAAGALCAGLGPRVLRAETAAVAAAALAMAAETE